MATPKTNFEARPKSNRAGVRRTRRRAHWAAPRWSRSYGSAWRTTSVCSRSCRRRRCRYSPGASVVKKRKSDDVDRDGVRDRDVGQVVLCVGAEVPRHLLALTSVADADVTLDVALGRVPVVIEGGCADRLVNTKMTRCVVASSHYSARTWRAWRPAELNSSCSGDTRCRQLRQSRLGHCGTQRRSRSRERECETSTRGRPAAVLNPASVGVRSISPGSRTTTAHRRSGRRRGRTVRPD